MRVKHANRNVTGCGDLYLMTGSATQNITLQALWRDGTIDSGWRDWDMPRRALSCTSWVMKRLPVQS